MFGFPSESSASSLLWYEETLKYFIVLFLIELFLSGLYDGSVAVYNVGDENKRPKYQSTARTGKHTDPVWQVGEFIFHEEKSNDFAIRIDSFLRGSLAKR